MSSRIVITVAAALIGAAALAPAIPGTAPQAREHRGQPRVSSAPADFVWPSAESATSAESAESAVPVRTAVPATSAVPAVSAAPAASAARAASAAKAKTIDFVWPAPVPAAGAMTAARAVRPATRLRARQASV